MSPAYSHNVERVNSIPLIIRRIVNPFKSINLILSFMKYLSRVLNSTCKHAYKTRTKKHFCSPITIPIVCVCFQSGIRLYLLLFSLFLLLFLPYFDPLTSTSFAPPQVKEVSAWIRYLTSTSPSRRIKY